MITAAQLWVLMGGYWWGEMLLGLPPMGREPFLSAAAVLFVCNYVVLRRGGWMDGVREALPAVSREHAAHAVLGRRGE